MRLSTQRDALFAQLQTVTRAARSPAATDPDTATSRSDVAKVVDFGLVKDLQSTEPVELTGANTIAGTPLYLSPEAITSAAALSRLSSRY